MYQTVQNWNLGRPRPLVFPWRGSDEGIYKHSTGESWASDTISVDREHGTGMEHLVCALATLPWLLYVTYIIVLVGTDLRKSVPTFCPAWCCMLKMTP
jgi:hypothetical protein